VPDLSCLVHHLTFCQIRQYPYRRRIRRGRAYSEALGSVPLDVVVLTTGGLPSQRPPRAAAPNAISIVFSASLSPCRPVSVDTINTGPYGCPRTRKDWAPRGEHSAPALHSSSGARLLRKNPLFRRCLARAYDIAKCAPDCGGTAKAVENPAAMPSTNVPESVVADIGAQRRQTTLIARSLFLRSASPADYGRALTQSVPGRMTQRSS
jgi:hypothetical protein